MKILLIAGHGAGDPGAIGKVNGKTYRESELARQVVQRVQNALVGYAQTAVYPTAQNAFDDQQMGRFVSKVAGYDYVLEIHFNASAKDAGNGTVKGSEAYVTTTEAGITVEEGILRHLASLGYTNRGVKRKNWSVIAAAKRAGVSSCLLEVCFIDDGDDMALYERTQEQAAQAIAQGIIEGFGLRKEDTTTETQHITPEEAIEILTQKGIINTPAYWNEHYKDISYLDALLIKIGEYIR